VIERPTVLRLVTRLNVGGPARHVAALTRATAATHPSIVAAGRPPAHEGELWPADLPLLHVPLVRAPAPIADASALAATVRLLRRHRPRILETHMAKAGAIGRSAAAAVRPRPATVHVFHGHVLSGYFSPRVERAFLAAERRLARRTDVLVAISEETRDDLLARGVGRRDQWRVVPLGIALEAYLAVGAGTGVLRRDLGVAAEVPLVGAVGRLAAVKHLDLLVRAVADPRLDGVHLALVGDGSDRARLAALAAALGIPDRVHFTGLRSDIPDVLADLDVVALTSRNEGTPMSLIEALAAARPVVATDVGGVRTVVRDGLTGHLVAADDVAALVAGLGRVLGDRGAAAAMARAGRDDVTARFGLDAMVATMTALYDDLLSR